MNFQEWMTKNNLTSDADKFKFNAWFKFQIQERHKKNLQVVNPTDIKLTRNTILGALMDHSRSPEGIQLVKKICNDLNAPVSPYGGDIKQIFRNEDAKIPNYLLSKQEREFGLHTVGCNKEEVTIDYSGLSIDFSPLHFATKGEFMVVIPKTNWEVHKGATFMNNCMITTATELIIKMKSTPKEFEEGFRYIDAHIVKDNYLIGVLALEEVFHIKKYGKPRKSLFVNFCNGVNKEMEKLCFELINEKLNLNLQEYKFTYLSDSPALPRNGAEISGVAYVDALAKVL